MTLVALCSAHGSPGVTTTALALAAGWPSPGGALLVEADPFGGVLAARLGLRDHPGLSSLAASSRAGLTAASLAEHEQRVSGGLEVVVGPPTPEEAGAVLRDVTRPLVDVALASGLDVIVDCGRVGPGSAALDLLCRADRVLVVVRPTADQLRLASYRLAALSAAGAAASLLPIGDTPYGPAEIASVLGVDVAGVIASDPRTAEALNGTGTLRLSAAGLRRSVLVRSAATLADALATTPAPAADGSTGAGGGR